MDIAEEWCENFGWWSDWF